MSRCSVDLKMIVTPEVLRGAIETAREVVERDSHHVPALFQYPPAPQSHRFEQEGLFWFSDVILSPSPAPQDSSRLSLLLNEARDILEHISFPAGVNAAVGWGYDSLLEYIANQLLTTGQRGPSSSAASIVSTPSSSSSSLSTPSSSTASLDNFNSQRGASSQMQESVLKKIEVEDEHEQGRIGKEKKEGIKEKEDKVKGDSAAGENGHESVEQAERGAVDGASAEESLQDPDRGSAGDSESVGEGRRAGESESSDVKKSEMIDRSEGREEVLMGEEERKEKEDGRLSLCIGKEESESASLPAAGETETEGKENGEAERRVEGATKEDRREESEEGECRVDEKNGEEKENREQSKNGDAVELSLTKETLQEYPNAELPLHRPVDSEVSRNSVGVIEGRGDVPQGESDRNGVSVDVTSNIDVSGGVKGVALAKVD